MWLEILLLLFLAFLFFYRAVTKNYNHFKQHGIPYIEPHFPMGTQNDVILKGRARREMVLKDYKKFKGEKFYGTFNISKPTLMLCDPELIKAVLVKDFNHFVDRNSFKSRPGLEALRNNKVWVKMMVNARGEEWKNARSTFSPIFTSGKLKAMMALINNVLGRLVDKVGEKADLSETFELKDMLGKFTMDTIASCAFGVDAESFTNPKSKFAKHAKSIFVRGKREIFLPILAFIPGMLKVFNFLQVSLFKPVETEFFVNIVETALRMRLSNQLYRNDMLDLVIDALKAQSDFTEDQKHKVKELDEATIISTALVILVAGYDTTAQTLAWACYRLAKNPDVQKKLQAEVDAAFNENNGDMPGYAEIQNLTYMEMVIHETLRHHPPLELLSRVCTKDYTLPGTNYHMKEGSSVHINVIGIHMDSTHYPEPELYNPEHFSKENLAKRHPYTFLGFGQGPRACIGMRFALLESKMALAFLLHNFDLLTCEKTVDKIVYNPKQIIGANMEGLWIRAKRRGTK